MANKISEEIKKAVFSDYQKGIESNTELAERYDISRRSVGRIIEKYLLEKYGDVFISDNITESKTETESVNDAIAVEAKEIPIRCFNTYALNGLAKVPHEFPFDEKEANTNGYAIADYAVQFLDGLIKQTEEIKKMCNKLKSIDTPHNLENNRMTLVNLIARLKWYELDTATIRLIIHKTEK